MSSTTGAAVQHAPAPALIELPERLAGSRAARPVRHRTTRPPSTAASSRRKRSSVVIRVSSRREQERLDAAMLLPDGMREVEEHARVALHRAADVADEDERSRTGAAPTSWQLDDVAARAEAARERASDVDARSASGDPAPGPPLAGRPRKARECRARDRDLLRCVVCEVLVREGDGITPGRQIGRPRIFLRVFRGDSAERWQTACIGRPVPARVPRP